MVHDVKSKECQRTQSPVAFAISSPTFFGDKPRGPILGASVAEAPISPPVALKWLKGRLVKVGCSSSPRRLCSKYLHDLYLIGIKFWSCIVHRY
jgi:hypothetical protein